MNFRFPIENGSQLWTWLLINGDSPAGFRNTLATGKENAEAERRRDAENRFAPVSEEYREN